MTQPIDPMERQQGVQLESDVKNPPDYAAGAGGGAGERTQDNAQDPAERAREAAGNVATTTREAAESVTDSAPETVDNIADRARETADNMTDRARDAEEHGRQEASSKLESVAEQLRDRAGGDGATGEIAEKAAIGIERTAGYIREHSTGDMTGDIESYVREHPMQGVAAAVLAGFFIGRVLR